MAEGPAPALPASSTSDTPPPAYSESNFITAKFNEKKIKFSVNLVEASRSSVDFLRLVSRYPQLYERPLINLAIYRYEKFWLPLAAKAGPAVTKWVAPLDIQWAWHVHMLAPVYYEKDCMALVGCIVDHELTPMNEYFKALSVAKKVWEREYPNEAFEIDLKTAATTGAKSEEVASFESKFSYDIAGASSRQKTFFYQVSLPHYLDRAFIEKAVQRYKKFCFLKSHNPNTFLVPCYDFDVVWHAHQEHPLKYKADTEKLIGKLLNHDDSVNNRNTGSKLMKADALTREMWSKVFNENFNINGAMFRGDIPSGINTMSKLELLKVGFAETPFRITHLKLTTNTEVGYQTLLFVFRFCVVTPNCFVSGI